MNYGRLLLGAACGATAVVAWRAAQRRWRRIDWPGRVVMITGGSRGLGLVLARQLVDAGAHVAICARNDEELSRAASELQARGGRVLAMVCDVTEQAQIDAFVQATYDRFGRIDVLINNAGIIQVGPVHEMWLSDFEEAMNINFWGPLRMTRAVAPGMQQQGGGRIVNIVSIGGKISLPHLLPYSTSKFAFLGLSAGLRSELAPSNILVTTICPHLMRTGSHHHALFKGQQRAEFAWFSLGASLPLVSLSAERAAATILNAAAHGDAEVTLSLQAKVLSRLYALFPNLSASVMTGVNRCLPSAPARPSGTRLGRDSHSWASPSWLTSLGDQAARQNNELSGSLQER